MERYFFFSIVVFDFERRFKNALSGTYVSDDGYDNMDSVTEFAKSKLSNVYDTDFVVLTGYCEMTKEHVDAFNNEKRS